MDTKEEGPGRDAMVTKGEEPGRDAMDTKMKSQEGMPWLPNKGLEGIPYS